MTQTTPALLSDLQSQRFARQISLPAIGEAGQRKLLDGSVLVVGAGGLGSPVCLYLAAAGVGRIGIVDGDSVDLSNLQRQIMHYTFDIGRLKTESAQSKLSAIFPEIVVQVHNFFADDNNLVAILSGYDVVVDATDSLQAKFMLNRVCARHGKPLVHGGIDGFGGEVLTISPKASSCYECAYRKPDTFVVPKRRGPLGPVPGIIGSIQAIECLKLLVGIGAPLYNTLFIIDTLGMHSRKFTVPRRPDCPACS